MSSPTDDDDVMTKWRQVVGSCDYASSVRGANWDTQQLWELRRVHRDKTVVIHSPLRGRKANHKSQDRPKRTRLHSMSRMEGVRWFAQSLSIFNTDSWWKSQHELKVL